MITGIGPVHLPMAAIMEFCHHRICTHSCQNPEQVDSAAFQLITQQQWTALVSSAAVANSKLCLSRPWKKNCQWPELECKKETKKIVLQFLVYQRHFVSSIEQADSFLVLHFPSALWSSPVASTVQSKIIRANLKAKTIIALRRPAVRTGGFKGWNGRTLSKLVVPWRFGQLTALHAEGKAKEYREKIHTLEKKKSSSEICVLLGAISEQTLWINLSARVCLDFCARPILSSVMTADEEQVWNVFSFSTSSLPKTCQWLVSRSTGPREIPKLSSFYVCTWCWVGLVKRGRALPAPAQQFGCAQGSTAWVIHFLKIDVTTADCNRKLIRFLKFQLLILVTTDNFLLITGFLIGSIKVRSCKTNHSGMNILGFME